MENICYNYPSSSSSPPPPPPSPSSSDVPLFFRCPISMELMEDPVTISTGVTYDRKNIEKWFNVYKKRVCPATMQRLDNLDLTPNHTLARLISSFAVSTSSTGSVEYSPEKNTAAAVEIQSLLEAVRLAPSKVNSLRKLRSAVAGTGYRVLMDLAYSGTIQMLARIIGQASTDEDSSVAFEAAEEAIGILHLLPLPAGEAAIDAITRPSCMSTIVLLLQNGSSVARLHSITLIQKITRTSRHWCEVIADQDVHFYKSLLDLLSDGASASSTSTAASIDVLTEIMTTSKRRRLRAVEAGAGPVLLELLPDANRHKTEKLLFLLKLLCECSEGRAAVTGHAMGVAVVAKKVMRVSDTATKIGVKILWLICSSAGTDKVVEEMMVFGAVKKLLALSQMECRPSSVKVTVVKILRLHGGAWSHYPCLSQQLKEYLRSLHRCRPASSSLHA